MQVIIMSQRSRTEIISLLLESAKAGATKTTLMYEAYLSFDGLQEYLRLMREMGLIRYLDGEMKFRTTPKGLEFLISHRRDKTESCSHQCRKCGVLYDCKQTRCQNPFQHGACNRCLKFFSHIEVQRILERT